VYSNLFIKVLSLNFVKEKNVIEKEGCIKGDRQSFLMEFA